MLKKQLVLSALMLSILSFSSAANEARYQTEASAIDRAILTTKVSNREPIDDLGHSYTHSGNDFDQLTFFTHLINHDGRGIVHRWYHDGVLESKVELAVGSNSWRTYSSKQISHLETGEWTIRVLNDRAEELVVYSFDVQY